MDFSKRGSTFAQNNAEATTYHIVLFENEDIIEDDTIVEDNNEVHSMEMKDDKPLMEEVTIINSANSINARGSKVWECKHYKKILEVLTREFMFTIFVLLMGGKHRLKGVVKY